MSETLIFSIIALIGGVGACIAVVLKNIKHSECCRCFKLDTRTPPPEIITPPPSPFNYHKKQPQISEEISV